MERRVRVGIDVDGVLRDFVGQTIKMAKDRGVEIARPAKYDYIDNYEIEGKSLRNLIWGSEEWLTEIFVDSDILPFARKGYKKFCNNPRYEVHIVTAQIEGTEQYTEDWLNKNGFDKHVKTHYMLKKLKAPTQILIDDKPQNVKEYSNNYREGYLVSCSYNLDSKFKPRVSSLLEAYKKIDERYGKRSKERSRKTTTRFNTV